MEENTIEIINSSDIMLADTEQEAVKCKHDTIYFIEHYCRVKTDYGDGNVKLNDYQKDIVGIL